MPLRLRLSSSLGPRDVEVHSRPLTDPLVVGRGPEAHLQVYSGNVAPRHCYLYVHEGRWIVADAGSPGGTYLNGVRLSDAEYLSSGDVISLGSGVRAASIEVDPHGVLNQSPRVGGALRPAPFFASGEPEGPTIEQAAAPVHAGGDDLWAASGTPLGYSRRRKEPSNAQTLGWAAGLGLVIVVVGGGLIYWLKQSRDRARPPAAVIAAAPAPSSPPTVFEGTPARPPGRPAEARPPAGPPALPERSAPSQARPPAPSPQPDRPAHPLRPDAPVVPTQADDDGLASPSKPTSDAPDWQRIEDARFSPAKVALWVYHDYRRRHPGVNSARLDELEEEALDLLWWVRIKELCDRRDAELSKASDTQAKIDSEPNADFRNRELMPRLAAAREAADALQRQIDAMAFRGNEPPNPFDPDQLDELRRQRDGTIYQTWRRQVLHSVQTRRALPWESGR